MPTLNPYLLGALALGWLLAALFGWGALHEYGIAHATAAQDSAIYAKEQAAVTAKALAEQQAIDAKQLAQADRMRRDAERAVKVAQATVHAALVHASAANSRIRVIVRHEPPSACARQPIPADILSQLNGH
ncbi:MAG TPA: hypothetical protein PLD10_07205 [Rhodopila sp.]|nr:hypothetical protein [Rhodopila sp.]